jgi:glycosyltransferase involved in cell wall biosynthesis
MRIGINTLAIVPGRSGGDGTYTRSLIEHLCHADGANRYYLFVAPYNRDWFAGARQNVRLVECPVPASFAVRVLYEQSVLPVVAEQLRLDVFHAPVNVAPLLLRQPYVLTVHDAVYRRGDVRVPLPLRLYWKMVRPRSAAGARYVIAMSETNKRELLAMGDVRESAVEVIYNGVQDRFRPLDRQECRAWARERHGLERPFVLWVGRPYASKNVGRLIEAFGCFNQRAGGRYLLALAGPGGWEDAALLQAVRQARVQAHVRQLGFVPNEDLPRLYNAAEALLYPSLEESFAFPVVEAMACGTPVITSGTSALPEIVGDAAELVDPLDAGDIAHSLEHVLGDASRAEELRARGPCQARRYSWAENAARTLQLYMQAAGEE